MSKADKERQKQISLYQQVFNTEAGRLVLTDILNDLQFFSMQTKTPEELALSNYAKTLLYKLGIWEPVNVWDITDTLLSIPAYAGIIKNTKE